MRSRLVPAPAVVKVFRRPSCRIDARQKSAFVLRESVAPSFFQKLAGSLITVTELSLLFGDVADSSGITSR
jgi:hypothetical protein